MPKKSSASTDNVKSKDKDKDTSEQSRKKVKDVLSLSMRPKSLDDLIGQEHNINLIKNQWLSGRKPHFIIISGDIGTGKTTLSRIISAIIQTDSVEISYKDINLSSYDITEINASDKNGVDDIRDLLTKIRYKPQIGSLAKIFILDEAHQLTKSAQDAFLKDTEEPPEHVFFIFSTNNVSKLSKALLRRAFLITMSSLHDEDIENLLKKSIGSEKDTIELKEVLIQNEVRSPGLILQACEKFLAGCKPIECIYSTDITNADTMNICRLVSSGKWSEVSKILSEIKKEDIFMLRNCILGYLKAILLKSVSSKAICLSEAILTISQNETYEIPAFLASVCIACSKLIKT